MGLACDLGGDADAGVGQQQRRCAQRLRLDLAPDAVGKGLFAAFSGGEGKVRYNLGEAPFKNAPLSADYVAFSEFDAGTSAKD